MFKKIFKNGSQFLTQRQTSILSAAVIIMIMIAASRLLGLIRNRVLANYFSVETLSVYFAAFRLPEVVFEILVFGALSSAFIPTFTAYISRQEKDQAWYVASVSLNFSLLFFSFLAIFIFLFAQPLYRLIAPGFSPDQIELVANLTKILLLTQGFFIFSYFMTGVLESFQRFLVPAIAPLFYNLGIILGTIFLNQRWGIYAPAIGATLGALAHFLIQLPLAFYLGFRPRLVLDLSHPGVREIGRLALPRIVELSFLQLDKIAELFLASLVTAAAYTHFTFANSLQLLPIGLFGVSLAKACLPTLSSQAAKEDHQELRETFISLFNQICFLIIPCSVFFIVLRIPIVRLAFGTVRFTWDSTLQTSYTLTAFCLGLSSQALIYLLTRTFWALHDTKTPVKISVFAIFIHIFLGAVFIKGLQWPIWSLALAFSLASFVQAGFLFHFLCQKLTGLSLEKMIKPVGKVIFASLFSGGLMFFLLKILDRSAWDKRLSFLGHLGLILPTTLDRFIFDTRYTLNVIILTALVGLIGLAGYLFLAKLLGVQELTILARFLLRLKQRGISRPKVSRKEEPITFNTNDRS